MLKPPLPPDEDERLQVLRAYGILDTDAEQEFDDLTKAASYVCNTPIALVSLVDADRQWFKSKVGLDVDETPREYAFCAHTILNDVPLVVPNAELDERFANNPLVAEGPKIRFYAGAPLKTSSGFKLGSLCVIDRAPRELTPEQLEVLQGLARQVVTQLELRANIALLNRRQKKVEKLERNSKAAALKLRGVIDNSRNFIGVLGLDGTLLDANRTSLTAAGVAFDEVYGKPFWETPWWSHSHELQQRLRQAVLTAASGVADGFDATHPTPDGSTIDVEFSLKPVLDGNGDVSCLIPEGRDVTRRNNRLAELSRLNRELARSNQELEQFAYVSSHDLQEPLRKVASFCELLHAEYGAKLDGDGETYIDFIIDGSRRMQTLIRDLLMFSRIQSHSEPPPPTSAQAALEMAIDNLSVAIEESGAEITNDELPTVMADPSQLTQLLQNLVGNAIKYRGAERPLIDIRVTEETGKETGKATGKYVISVADNGIGIAPEYHKRIFGVFKRLHTRAEYAGTGIGLAICKRIVERWNEELWVESSTGNGSTFYFTVGKTTSGEQSDTSNVRAGSCSAG